ncbi:Putative beta-barrel porin-2, OmpL-like. bbp2 [Pseudomonas japonica]|uniref:Putative beta-barrel porin-2, OmpL-like. bbp2 n=2 Tax=Pseudomonas japonica TaxID=256466 RepID=A0A239JH50_9PSED|nr:Putative beta-barrel porin-2, OmpL-like. bbp2 [Pseudomonas japonica]
MLGPDFEKSTGVRIKGVIDVGFSQNDNTSDGISPKQGSGNHPITGPADEGFQLNAFQLTVEKQIKSNVIPRVTPLPGPRPDEFSWGFTAELLYGRNALPAAMFGFDQHWGINRPGNVDPVEAATNRDNYLAMPQAFLQAYIPVLDGLAITAGRFGSGVGYEIPPPTRPSPNFFYSYSYALVAQPDQVSGVLLSTNLYRGSAGLLAAEFGVAVGRQNWQDNNAQQSVLGALRYRTPDMQTWVDYSFMSGDEQNDIDHDIQMPVSRILADEGLRREHHSLVVQHQLTPQWKVIVEGLYGRQEGDRSNAIDLVTGQPFSGAHYRGVNATARYKYSETLEYGVRLERFEDPDGFALFPTTAVAGTFNAVTLGVNWNPTPHVLVRPEIRYDWQSDNGEEKAFANARDDRQTTLSVDAKYYF